MNADNNACSKAIDIKKIDTKTLECPYCLEIFKDPYILLCGHTYCFECIKVIQDNEKIKCPLCSNIQFLINGPYQKNYSIEGIITSCDELNCDVKISSSCPEPSDFSSLYNKNKMKRSKSHNDLVYDDNTHVAIPVIEAKSIVNKEVSQTELIYLSQAVDENLQLYNERDCARECYNPMDIITNIFKKKSRE